MEALLLGVVVVAINWRALLSLLVVFFGGMRSALAEMMEKGKSRVKTVFNLYHQNSNDGHQIVDNSGREEVTVFEPMIFVETQITEDTAINGKVIYDGWTAASDSKIDDYTGASDQRIEAQSRIAADIGVRREVEKWTYGGNFGFSSEYDYQSFNLALNASRSFAKDNFTLGGSIQYFHDEVMLFQDFSNPRTAKISTGLPRRITALTMSASQILTAKDLAQFEVTYAHAEKNLESTSNTVLVGTSRQLEKLPPKRDRAAATAKWVHGLGEASALNLSYRYYQDSWGATAHTGRLAYLFEYNDEEDYIELYARYHTQSEVDYFQERFANAAAYMTSDTDMEKFQSRELGAFIEQSLVSRKIFGRFNLDNMTWGNGVVMNLRTNGMRQAYYQTSLNFEF